MDMESIIIPTTLSTKAIGLKICSMERDSNPLKINRLTLDNSNWENAVDMEYLDSQMTHNTKGSSKTISSMVKGKE